MKRILICGGRDYGKVDARRPLDHPKRMAERRRLSEVLSGLYAEFGPFQMIHGAARGADALADAWWHQWDADGAPLAKPPEPLRFPADWDDIGRPGAVLRVAKGGPYRGKTYDAAAGGVRNQKMIDEGKPDLVVAFAGGTGTADMVGRSRTARIEVREIA